MHPSKPRTLGGWGRFPLHAARGRTPLHVQDILPQGWGDDPHIARGLGRSYGDSALADWVVEMRGLDQFIDFDPASGILHCAAGVSLAEILELLVPRGWFPPVTPGTCLVTLGGAIAADVHGKNHHLNGSFSDHLIDITIATLRDGLVTCSPDQHPELFHATCGGMGLTGVIVSARLRMRPIQSAWIDQTTFKAARLEDALELFEATANATYSVAWIDCLSRGRALGRSLLMIGEHAHEGGLDPGQMGRLSIPTEMPGQLLNPWSIRLFNALYYHRISEARERTRIHFRPFFYPLDSIHQWNRLYGPNGFVQYQFVLPQATGRAGLSQILRRIADSRRGSFLAVLKAFGPANDNLLSFPLQGYTLALDFKVGPGLFELLDELDHQVVDLGGRIYLAKDARMSRDTFRAGYPRWEEFARIRADWQADRLLHSLQSRRLGL